MNTEVVVSWIKGLGLFHDVLSANKTIPDQPLLEFYEGRDWLHIEPEPGVELSFWAESKRFEKLFFSLFDSVDGTPIYSGELPAPFSLKMKKADAIEMFGAPLETQGPVLMPKPVGQTGGWDSFVLDALIYPNIKVVFQYSAGFAVNTLVFALIEKDHD